MSWCMKCIVEQFSQNKWDCDVCVLYAYAMTFVNNVWMRYASVLVAFCSAVGENKSLTTVRVEEYNSSLFVEVKFVGDSRFLSKDILLEILISAWV